MVSVYRGIAIKTSVISAVLLLITCILPSLSDEDMTFPYSMIFWFVLILTAVRTIASVRDIMRDKDYYLQNMAIAAIISEDKDADKKDDNSDADIDDRRPEVIIIICDETKNEHFKKFGQLLKKHIDGIVTFAKYKLTSGKIEGFNNKIKTIRRAGYGYPDDEYFFLKIMDASRHGYAQK